MFNITKGNQFESKVHLGLLAFIFILLFINFVSNYIIFRAKEAKHLELTDQFNNAALAIGRIIEDINITSLTEEQERDFIQSFQLKSILLFPTQPENASMKSKRLWFASIAKKLKPYQIPELAEKLLTTDYKAVTRGNGKEYYYINPVTTRSGHYLLLLSKDNSELAFYDNSQKQIVIAGVIAIIIMAIIYLLLSRSIFSPFRKIKDEAKQAGRKIELVSDDADAIVSEYRSVINELKEKEQLLLKLNKEIRYKADSLEQFNDYLLSSIESGIITVDNNGTIITVNNAAQKILNIDYEIIKGKFCDSIFTNDNKISNIVTNALVNKHNQSYQEFEFVTNDNKKLTLGITTSIITDFQKESIGVAVLMNDLSEITLLSNELEIKNKLATLGEMTGGLAHQLRNSIGAISGYLSLLKKRSVKKGFEDNSIEALIYESNEAQDLVERFLQFSKPLQLNYETHVLNDLINDVKENIYMRYDRRDYSIEVPQESIITIEIDGLLFKQALTNIIENSINSYNSEKGLIKVLFEQLDYELTIKIQDYGCGIGSDNIEKIFTPFFSSRPSGNGLGLPLAGKIINMHSGRIAVESEPGKGTIFSIILPCNMSDKGINQREMTQNA